MIDLGAETELDGEPLSATEESQLLKEDADPLRFESPTAASADFEYCVSYNSEIHMACRHKVKDGNVIGTEWASLEIKGKQVIALIIVKIKKNK